MKPIVIAMCLVLAVFVNESQSVPTLNKRGLGGMIENMLMKSAESKEVDVIPELDYASVKFDNVELKVQEIDLQPSDLYAKVIECVKKCMENAPKNSYRDKCLAKTCDIY